MTQTVLPHSEFNNATEFREAAEIVAATARRHIRIFSPHLEPEIFESQTLLDALSTVARQHRYSEVRILIVHNDLIVSRGHRLVDLSRALPSSVMLRKLNYNPGDYPGSYLLADTQGVVHRPEEDDDHGYACSDYPSRAKELAEQFDQLWERSYPDPELRELRL